MDDFVSGYRMGLRESETADTPLEPLGKVIDRFKREVLQEQRATPAPPADSGRQAAVPEPAARGGATSSPEEALPEVKT